MKHPFLNDDVVDVLRRLNVEQAKNPGSKSEPLPEGWCRCGAALCPCDGGIFNRGQVQRGIGARSWSVDPHLRRVHGHHAGGFIGLEGDWCRPGLPGGISALRSTLAPATTSKVATAAAAAPVTAPVLAPVAVIRPPWYLGYTLWTRGLWPKRKTA